MATIELTDEQLEKLEWKVGSSGTIYAMFNSEPIRIGQMINMELAQIAAIYHNRIVQLRRELSDK